MTSASRNATAVHTRTKNAYMLIYERTAYFHMPTVRQLVEELRVMKVHFFWGCKKA